MATTITQDDLKRWAMALSSEIQSLKDGLRDKGPKYFARPLGISAMLVFASYHYVYKAPQQAMVQVLGELDAAKATAQYANDYQDLKDRLNRLYSSLPKTRDPATWLLSEVRDSLRQEGIVPDSFSSPTDEAGIGYKLVSMTISLTTSYPQLAAWVARIERSKYLMHIKDVKLVKMQKSIGMNTVDVTITTIIPLGDDAPSGGMP
jgi:Tfp pilus assembly protein PilO